MLYHLMNVFHDGIFITDLEKIVFNNKVVLKIYDL